MNSYTRLSQPGEVLEVAEVDEKARSVQRRLRISGVLTMLGLVVEALSLIRIHPLAFLAFMFIGGAFLVVGIGIYLYSLASLAR
jgi:predicted membrane channel-forming protein YqfA (hemolysin III family)